MKPETHCSTCKKDTLTNDSNKCVVCNVTKVKITLVIN